MKCSNCLVDIDRNYSLLITDKNLCKRCETKRLEESIEKNKLYIEKLQSSLDSLGDEVRILRLNDDTHDDFYYVEGSAEQCDLTDILGLLSYPHGCNYTVLYGHINDIMDFYYHEDNMLTERDCSIIVETLFSDLNDDNLRIYERAFETLWSIITKI